MSDYIPAADRVPFLAYEIVEHDGGWAYRVGDTLSETFASRGSAMEAAREAAERQQIAAAVETDTASPATDLFKE